MTDKDRRPLFRESSAAVVAVGVAAFALIVGCIAWSAFQDRTDPRAYVGSDITSMDEAQDRYHFRLPDCSQASVKFGQYGELMIHSFYLDFSGDGQCISHFLAMNGLRDRPVQVDGFPARLLEGGKALGWPRDDGRKYSFLTGELIDSSRPSSVALVQVAIDCKAVPCQLYLLAEVI